MSKKKKAVVPSQPSQPQPASKTTPLPVQKNAVGKSATPPEPFVEPADQPFELIRFDKRVKWFTAIWLGLFLILALSKIHFSSIPYWNQVIPDGSNPKRGLIAGTPRAIRMDEWAAMVPFVLSQANNGYPQENPAIGGEKPGLVVYLPIKHFITVFRPNYWGFTFLDTDRGFAWNGLFYPFFGLLVVVYLFLVLTKNQFWLSLFGAVWFVLSPAIAWWSFSPLTHVFSGSLILLASFYIFYARQAKTLIWAGVLFAWALITFSLNLYPPYQVPFGYLLIFLLIGFVWSNYRKELLFNQLIGKIITFGLAGLVIAAVVYAYYVDAKPTIDVMSNTVYPGKRSDSGGTGFIANWLSEYYSGWLLNDQRFPKEWLNICELSHAVTFMPVIAISLGLYFSKTKKIDPLLTIILAYSVILLVWIQFGFPTFLAKATLLDVSPTRRTQVPLGMANVVLAVLYLAYIRGRSLAISASVKTALIAFVVVFMVYAAWLNLTDSNGYYKAYQLFIPTLFFMVLNYLMLPVQSFRYKAVLVSGLMVLFSLPSLGINPLSVGLSPITEHVLYQKVSELHKQEPKARWVVIGSQYLTYLVTATGVNQLSGIKFMPDFKTMRVLDPTAKRDSAYNRYAHTVYASYIDGRDSTIIVNQFEDGYTVALDPCSPKLKTLDAKYFIFEKKPQPVEVRCMTQVATLGSIEIYKRNDF
ncbi:DUF7657 domain-containing protein [Spirosoma agri]|uniref:YfhO family protein n=1 Tax=Spirosoma agri TaxID=1987381 RepID=A0A6M0IE21_9BACT|nr:hypothetical protein [Spirosoma agri]NEU65591.1 hypothetical protein [Spirosoma agri]